MVRTRRKSSQDLDDGDDDAVEEQQQQALTPREKRRQQRESLKAKNTGTGLSISTGKGSNNTPKNKKIVFDDDLVLEQDNEVDEAVETNITETTTKQDDDEHSDDDDDDDDDAVEEVKGDTARSQILEQMESERTEALRTTAKKKKKRKERPSKKVVDDEDDDDDNDEFDEDFFAQVDTVMEEEKKKAKLEHVKPQGKHTTFVFDEEEQPSATLDNPQDVDHNIQVVVLNEPESTAQLLPIMKPISKEALLFSRNSISSGPDNTPVGSFNGKKRQRKDAPTWKRSKKMKSLAARGRNKAFFSKSNKR